MKAVGWVQHGIISRHALACGFSGRIQVRRKIRGSRETRVPSARRLMGASLMGYAPHLPAAKLMYWKYH
jgi:hypothetical protein